MTVRTLPRTPGGRGDKNKSKSVLNYSWVELQFSLGRVDLTIGFGTLARMPRTPTMVNYGAPAVFLSRLTPRFGFGALARMPVMPSVGASRYNIS